MLPSNNPVSTVPALPQSLWWFQKTGEENCNELLSIALKCKMVTLILFNLRITMIPYCQLLMKRKKHLGYCSTHYVSINSFAENSQQYWNVAAMRYWKKKKKRTENCMHPTTYNLIIQLAVQSLVFRCADKFIQTLKRTCFFSLCHHS